MNRIAGRTGITVVIVLALMVGMLFFLWEFTSKADTWVVFSGSPHVYNGGNIGCGSVTDRDGTPLLNMTDSGRIYSADTALRLSTVHWVGDRYGSIHAPALANYSVQMAGFDLLNGVYAYGIAGGTAELTLSGKVQMAALEALEGRKGTVGVFNYKTGELICAVTSPTFDPDNVPDLSQNTDGSLDGIYLNRFLQSAYIPGSIFKIVTLAAALEEMPEISEETFVCTGSYQFGKDEVVCEDIHWEQSLKDAFRNSCNCAFAAIAQKLGAEVLTRYAEQFRITESVTFDGITTAKGNFDILEASEVNVAWSSIGQYTDQINPCRFMTFMGAIACEGKGSLPYVVGSITDGGIRSYSVSQKSDGRIMSSQTARILREYLEYNVTSKYGADNFPGMTVCAKTGTGEVDGGKKPNAMLAGFVADSQYPLAFIVTVEDGGYGKTVCIPIISKVLAACKEVM